MMTFISCAKTMTDERMADVPFMTEPSFQEMAERNAAAMTAFSTEELERLLGVSRQIAEENRMRYLDFRSPQHGGLPALLAYTGIVFKHIRPQDFTPADFRHAQEHLLITSFLYGLLRPLDGIRSYRMEGDVKLPGNGGLNMFDWWKPLLTGHLIEAVKQEGGILVNLASGEMKRLFDWKEVCKETKVVTPEFQVWKDGKLTTPAVYAKMCRGEMTRFILKDQISSPEDLKSFSWNGFRFDESASSKDRYFFRTTLQKP